MVMRYHNRTILASEHETQQRILLACGNGAARLWRNNVGTGWAGNATRVTAGNLRALGQGLRPGDVVVRAARLLHAGLCLGSSDLIGYTSVLVGPEHVGLRLAVFAAVEVKSATGRATAQQQAFLEHVRSAGGRAGIARTVADGQAIMEAPLFHYRYGSEMKVTAGAHPDLPYPFSNGPESPPATTRGLHDPLPLASERHEQGVQALKALLNYWLGRSGLSHDQLVAIASWAMGEPGMLDKTVISRIRNGKHVRGASLKHLDALAGANRAIWLWKTQGPDAARAELGPHSGWGVQDEWLDDAIWLPREADEQTPLTFADFASVMAGHTELPYLQHEALSPIDVARLNDGLAQLLEALIADRGWGPREAIRQLLEAYPANDTARQQRLRGVIVGDVRLTKGELEGELFALAEMIRAVRELKPGSYGPGQLRQELLSGRRFHP